MPNCVQTPKLYQDLSHEMVTVQQCMQLLIWKLISVT